jgi:hypothetical protein
MAQSGKWSKVSLILSIILIPLLALAGQRIGRDPDYAEFDSNASLHFFGNATLFFTTSTSPVNATDGGAAGQFMWDGEYFYVHNGTSWRRVQLNTW